MTCLTCKHYRSPKLCSAKDKPILEPKFKSYVSGINLKESVRSEVRW